MYKVALLSAMGAVSARKINIDLFKLENFFNMKTQNLAQSLIKSVGYIGVNGLGDVTYEQCDDDVGDFTLDPSATRNEPNPVVKNADVKFILDGILSNPVHLDNVHIHVDWNGSSLYDEDNKEDNDYTDEVEVELSWNVPSFAPSGHYDVTITGTGKENENVLCVKAQMDL